jgi:hypothetical protein
LSPEIRSDGERPSKAEKKQCLVEGKADQSMNVFFEVKADSGILGTKVHGSTGVTL